MTDDVNWRDNPLEHTPPVRGSGNFLKDRGYADPDGMRERFMLANEIELILERIPPHKNADALAEACTVTGVSPELAARIVSGVVSDASTYDIKALIDALRVRHDVGVDVVSVS